MSSADNKKLLQDMFAGLANRDSALFLDALADDVTWSIIGSNSWSGAYIGKEAVLCELLMPLRNLLAERSKTVAQRFIVDGDVAAVEARGHNVTRAGTPYNNEYCLVFRFAGGKIVEVIEYSDTELIAKALTDRSVAIAAMD